MLYEEFSGVSFLWLMPSVYFVWKDDEKGENVASRPTSPLPSGESGGRRLKIIYQNKRAREVLSANTNINSSRTIAAADRLLLFAAVATCVKRDRETETERSGEYQKFPIASALFQKTPPPQKKVKPTPTKR